MSEEEKVYTSMYSRNTELYHHGIQGQKWGVTNGPPYPLDSDVSTGKKLKKEKRLNAYKEASIKKLTNQQEKMNKKMNKKINKSKNEEKREKIKNEQEKRNVFFKDKLKEIKNMTYEDMMKQLSYDASIRAQQYIMQEQQRQFMQTMIDNQQQVAMMNMMMFGF